MLLPKKKSNDLRLALPVSQPTASWPSFTPGRKHEPVPKNCKWAFRLVHFRLVSKLNDSQKKHTKILDIDNLISFVILGCNLWKCEYPMRKSWVTAYLHGAWYFENFINSISKFQNKLESPWFILSPCKILHQNTLDYSLQKKTNLLIRL